MPELPDVVVYLEALEKRVVGEELRRIAIQSPFVLRSVDPPIREAEGKLVVGLRRLGKRIVIALEGELFLVIHLMIAGRLRWRAKGKAILGTMKAGKSVLAALEFPEGTLFFTEAGTKKRASMFLVRGEEALRSHDRGGLEVLSADREAFAADYKIVVATAKIGSSELDDAESSALCSVDGSQLIEGNHAMGDALQLEVRALRCAVVE
jgi:formamidopyrimidine-DNA glycosylase